MLGLMLGLFCAVLALWRVFTLKLELRRFRRHLSDRVELEAEAVAKAKGDTEALRRENEQLRIKVGEFNQLPEWRLQRDLEVFARAEKQMLINVPGFAPAWENAKTAADAELKEEEAGRNLPKRVFTKLFGSNSALPSRENVDISSLPGRAQPASPPPAAS